MGVFLNASALWVTANNVFCNRKCNLLCPQFLQNCDLCNLLSGSYKLIIRFAENRRRNHHETKYNLWPTKRSQVYFWAADHLLGVYEAYIHITGKLWWVQKWLVNMGYSHSTCPASHPTHCLMAVVSWLWMIWGLSNMKPYCWAFTCRTFCPSKGTFQTCLSSCILSSWLYTLHGVIYRQLLAWGHRRTKSGMGTHFNWDCLDVNPCFSICCNGWLRTCEGKCCSVKLGQCMNCRDNQIWSVVFSPFLKNNT